MILVSSSISAVAASDRDGDVLTAVTDDAPPVTAAGAVGGRIGVGDLPLFMDVWICSR